MARISSDTAEVKVEAVDNTKAGLDSVRRNVQDLERSVLSLQKIIMQATGAVLAMKGAWNLADQAAGFMEQEAALNRLAAAYGSSSKIMIDSIKQAADGTISSLDAVNIATQGLAKGLTPDQIANLTQVAKAYGDITNQSTAQALNEIATAAETGRSRMLQQAGIIVDLNKAWDEYAKSTGRTVAQLTEAEKRQVSVNAIMKASSDVMIRTASAGMSAADAMDKFKAALSDIGIFAGKVVITIATATFGITQVISQIVNGVLATIAGMIEMVAKGINDFTQKLPVPQWLKDSTAAVATGTGEITKYFEDSTNIAGDNFKQSVAMIKGYWSELGALPKTSPLQLGGGEGSAVGGGPDLQAQEGLRIMQMIIDINKDYQSAINATMSEEERQLAQKEASHQRLLQIYDTETASVLMNNLAQAQSVQRLNNEIKTVSTSMYNTYQQQFAATKSIGAAAEAAVRQAVAARINAYGAEAGVAAGMEFAAAWASLATYQPAQAAQHTAAGFGYLGVAALAGVGASLVAGAPSGGGSSTPTGGGTFSNSSLQPTQQEQQKVTTILLPNDELVSRKYILNVLWPTISEAQRNGELINIDTAGAPIYG